MAAFERKGISGPIKEPRCDAQCTDPVTSSKWGRDLSVLHFTSALWTTKSLL